MNCRGIKAHFNDLVFVTKKNKPAIICLKETFLEENKINIKNFENYKYMNNTELRFLWGVSILIRNNIPQIKINLNTNLQEIVAKATLYISPQDSIKENDINNLIKLHKPFIILEDLNSHNIIWDSKKKKKMTEQNT